MIYRFKVHLSQESFFSQSPQIVDKSDVLLLPSIAIVPSRSWWTDYSFTVSICLDFPYIHLQISSD